ncbi:hypothetical protein BCD15_004473, partial [Escherichia coli]|nr:hypothetical protein [Escherichia coli]
MGYFPFSKRTPIYWWCTTLEGMRDLIKSQPVYEIQYYGKTFRMNA